MRVIVLGTAGMEKKKFIDSVVNVAYSENFVNGRRNPESKGFCEVYDLDRNIKEELGGLPAYAAYLDDPNAQHQQSIWDKSCQHTLDNIDKTKPKHVFLVAHGSYYRNKRFFSRLNWNHLRKFKPSIIITLIDDAFDVRKRIARVESRLRTRSECTLSEAIEWRTVELLIGDVLSENLVKNMNIPHYVLAIKHLPQTLYRLLFEPWRLILYTAFPIGVTRQKDAAIAEINNFRKDLRQRFTVFDPVTIDEYPLIDSTIKRWPLGNGDTEPEVTVEEIKSIESAILENIEARDFRYVSQSDGIVVYRVFWGKRESPSRGVDREMMQALAQNKPIYVVHGIDDGGLSPRQKLFQPIARAQSIKSSTKEIIAELQKWQAEKKKQYEPVKI